MKIKNIFVLAILACALFVYALSVPASTGTLSALTGGEAGQESNTMSETAATEHVIEIHRMKFSASALTVKPGDKVTWINKDIVAHTATASDKSWDSGRLKKGESFTLLITEEMTKDYFCFYHRQMKAKLLTPK